MNEIHLGCIVEGHGEVEAFPILVRRLAASIAPALHLRISVRRIPKSQLVREGEIERSVEALTRQIGRLNPVLILLDADEDCPANLARGLAERCRNAHRDVHASIVVAKAEYEAWFIAAFPSLLACRDEFTIPMAMAADPEAIRGAKEWLSARMKSGNRYSETRHQPIYSAIVDISQAMNARSFRKLAAAVHQIAERANIGT